MCHFSRPSTKPKTINFTAPGLGGHRGVGKCSAFHLLHRGDGQKIFARGHRGVGNFKEAKFCPPGGSDNPFSKGPKGGVLIVIRRVYIHM